MEATKGWWGVVKNAKEQQGCLKSKISFFGLGRWKLLGYDKRVKNESESMPRNGERTGKDAKGC